MAGNGDAIQRVSVSIMVLHREKHFIVNFKIILRNEGPPVRLC